MNKFPPTSKKQHIEEVNQLVSLYQEQRSLYYKQEESVTNSVNLKTLNSYNFSPWDYNLADSNIVVKTEKNLEKMEIDIRTSSHSFAKRQFAEWSNMKSNFTGEKNSVLYAPMKTEPCSYEENYLSLKIFLAGCNATYKRELSGLLCPVFVHFYLDLITGVDFSAAQAFFNKFNHDHEENYKNLIELLPKVSTISQLKLYPILKEFRENKAILELSSDVYLYFLQHLRHGNYLLILQTLNSRFDVKTSNDTVTSRLQDDEATPDNNREMNTFSWSPTEQGLLKNLRESINILENTHQSVQPSICLYSLSNNYKGITCCSFSQYQTYLAAGFADSSVCFWNHSAQSNLENNADVYINDTHILRGHSGDVYKINFLPSDRHLLSASRDKTVRLWSLESCKSLVEYKGHDASVWDICVSNHGSYFVSASMDTTARLWNTEYVYPLRVFAGHVDSVDCVCFHPNSNYVATGSTDKSCRLWDLQSGQFVRVFLGHTASICSLAFSYDGKYLVSAGVDSTIMLWDLSNGQLLTQLKSSSTKPTYCLSFSSDSSTLASGGLDPYLNFWESETIFKKGQSKIEPVVRYSTHRDRTIELKFASRGNFLYAATVTDDR